MSELGGSSVSSRRGYFTKRSEIAFIARIVPQTYLSESDVKYLIRLFGRRANEGRYMDKSDFLCTLRDCLGYMEHFFMNRVFLQCDLNHDGKIDLEEFIRFMSLVLRGTREDKIRFCFSCYDLNETNTLSRDVIVTLLTHTSTEGAVDRNADTVLDLLDVILRKIDKDADGVVNYDEFRGAANDDWLLTEVFGQCLPDYTLHMTFLENMEKNIDLK